LSLYSDPRNGKNVSIPLLEGRGGENALFLGNGIPNSIEREEKTTLLLVSRKRERYLSLDQQEGRSLLNPKGKATGKAPSFEKGSGFPRWIMKKETLKSPFYRERLTRSREKPVGKTNDPSL